MTAQRPRFLHIELLSDTTFGRGEETAGSVDVEVEHDRDGIPFIGGKTIRGLLRDSWLTMCSHFGDLTGAAERVLGRTRTLDDACRLRIGDALAPEPVRRAAQGAVVRGEHPLSSGTVLDAFTAIRYQTAENRMTGAPETGTLRSSRVVLRGFAFDAPLHWLDGEEPTVEDLRVLAMCALATRHGGLGRNRGRGHIRITLDGDLATTSTVVGEAISDQRSNT